LHCCCLLVEVLYFPPLPCGSFRTWSVRHHLKKIM
jgi:hypothetical protein